MPEIPEERFGLPEGDLADLRSLLESVSTVGARFHYRIAALHYGSYLAAASSNDRKIFALEIFCKLMQSIEDYGAFSLMWLEETGNPLATYLSVVTPKIVKFYRECGANRDDAKMRKIWGAPPSDVLIQSGLIAEGEREHFEKCISDFFGEIDKNLKQIGNLFRESGDSAHKNDYGDVVNMYFNAKHGVKALFSTASSKSIGVTDDALSILIGPGKSPSGETFLKIGKFGTRPEVILRMVENCESTCEKMRLLAKIHLARLDNKQFFIEAFRETQRKMPGYGA